METLVTCDLILDWIKNKIENKEEIAPSTLLDATLKLSVLVGAEQDKLYELQQTVALARVTQIEAGKNATTARMVVEASDVYKEMKKMKSKIENIFEFIRIMKLRSRMKSDEFYSM